MTYRCVDCVYSEIIDKNTCDMKCLKHDKSIKCMDNHCNDLILEPVRFLSHISYHYNYEKYVKKGKFDWKAADKMAIDHLEKFGFAGMTVPENITPGARDELNPGEIELIKLLTRLKELMIDAYYGFPKELYDIRLDELKNFIFAQNMYDNHFKLVTREEVKEVEQ